MCKANRGWRSNCQWKASGRHDRLLIERNNIFIIFLLPDSKGILRTLKIIWWNLLTGLDEESGVQAACVHTCIVEDKRTWVCQYVSDRGHTDTPRPSVTSNGAANYEDYNVQCPAQRSGHFADTERGRGGMRFIFIRHVLLQWNSVPLKILMDVSLIFNWW